MKLKRLSIRNFVGIESADLAFLRPVTLLLGTNNMGKSSVRDAIQFALTGKARAMRFAKEVGHLIHGDNGMAVELDYLDGSEEIRVRRTKTNIGTHVDERAVLRSCLNPSEFIALTPKERTHLLSEVLGGGMKEVIKTAIVEHVGEIDETVLSEIKGSGVNLLDVDALRAQVVEQRRRYKRLLEELPAKPPLLSDYELEQDYEVTKDETVVKTLAERIAKGSQILADAQAMFRTQAQIADLERELRHNKEAHKEVPNLPRGVSKDKLNMAPVYLAIMETIIAEATVGECCCPVCESETNPDKIKELHKELAKWYETYRAKLEERAAIIEANERLDFEQQVKSKVLKETMGRLVEVDVPKDGEDLLAQLQSDRDAAQARIAHYQRFQGDWAKDKQAGERREQFTRLITECNRIDEALKDGGPVKAAIAAGGRRLPINESLLKVWNMSELAWADNGEITLRGLPIEYASESERHRAGYVMGLALAQVSGIGIAAIDEGFSVLDSDNANAFFGAITECKLNNVLVCASIQEDYSAVELPEWLEVFVVEQGKISRVP